MDHFCYQIEYFDRQIISVDFSKDTIINISLCLRYVTRTRIKKN